jgi:cyclase
MVEVVARSAEQVFIPLTVGGGVRGVPDAMRLLRAGADKVAVNTAAVDCEGLVGELAKELGAQCVVVAIDARATPGSTGLRRYEVVTHGGRRPTGLDVIDWARRCEDDGAGEILLTSMDRDGTRLGYDLILTRAVCDAVSVPVVASGGVGTLDHLTEGALLGGADALLAASIFHMQEHSIAEAKAHLEAAGVSVRPVSD